MGCIRNIMKRSAELIRVIVSGIPLNVEEKWEAGRGRRYFFIHFFQVTEFNKLGVKLLVLSALNREGGS